MSAPDFGLLRTRRFLPLFLAQFLGALNDNVFRSALVILVTYRLAEQAGWNPQLMATAAAGIFILPFFLFSAIAGRFADRFDKAVMIRLVKVSEIALMALAGWGFIAESLPLLMTVLFLMGVHSTFFGPVKYAILPQHLRRDELVAGNGLIEAGTFLAILLGTIVGGMLVPLDGGIAAVLSVLAGLALAGLPRASPIPHAPPRRRACASSLNILARHRRHAELRRHAPRRLFAVDPRHLLVLAGRRRVAVAVAGLREAMSLAATSRSCHAVPDRVLDRHRRRLAAVQPAAQGRGLGAATCRSAPSGCPFRVDLWLGDASLVPARDACLASARSSPRRRTGASWSTCC